MSNQDNTDAILAAIRRAGITIPGVEPISVRRAPTTLSVVPELYWHITAGRFDTFVDSRDAKDQDNALTVAMHPLHPWYVCNTFYKDEEAYNEGFYTHVYESNRSEYIEWLKRGVS